MKLLPVCLLALMLAHCAATLLPVLDPCDVALHHHKTRYNCNNVSLRDPEKCGEAQTTMLLEFCQQASDHHRYLSGMVYGVDEMAEIHSIHEAIQKDKASSEESLSMLEVQTKAKVQSHTASQTSAVPLDKILTFYTEGRYEPMQSKVAVVNSHGTIKFKSLEHGTMEPDVAKLVSITPSDGVTVSATIPQSSEKPQLEKVKVGHAVTTVEKVELTFKLEGVTKVTELKFQYVLKSKSSSGGSGGKSSPSPTKETLEFTVTYVPSNLLSLDVFFEGKKVASRDKQVTDFFPCTRSKPKAILSVFKKPKDKDEERKKMTKIEITGKSALAAGAKLLLISESAFHKVLWVHKADGTEVKATSPGSGVYDVSGEQYYYIRSSSFARKCVPAICELKLFVRVHSRNYELDSIHMRVAPWMAISHEAEIQQAYALKFTPHTWVGAEDTTKSFKDALAKMTPKPKFMHFSDAFDTIWYQDFQEIGFTQNDQSSTEAIFFVKGYPQFGASHDAFKEMTQWYKDLNDGKTVAATKDILEKAGATDVMLAFADPTGAQTGNFDSGGNIEVTPPLNHGKLKWPLGRMILGDNALGHAPKTAKIGSDEWPVHNEAIDDAELEFWRKQGVQLPIRLYSGWLSVGHVDEMLTFVPDKASPIGFRVLYASPKKAVEILASKKASHGSKELFLRPHSSGGIRFQDKDEGKAGDKWTVDSVHKYFATDPAGKKDVANVERYIKVSLDILAKELEVGSSDHDKVFFPVPVLFVKEGSDNTYGAYYPDLVNAVVGNGYILPPNPYSKLGGTGPDIFLEGLKAALPSTVKIAPVDEWATVHDYMGEIHCASNVLRKPPTTKWYNFT